MQQTVEFLESLPPYEKGQYLSPSWEDMCRQASSLAKQDILALLDAAQKSVRRKLLPDAVFDGRYFLEPYGQLLDELAPLLGEGDATGLKRNCFDLLNPALGELGYAVSAMSAASTYVRVRIVWVYTPFRTTRPMKQYLPCATLRVNFSDEGVSGAVQWMPRTAGEMSYALHCRLIQEMSEPVKVLSETGMESAANCFAWKKGLRKSPRREAHDRRVRFVAANPDLWIDHEKLASALIAAGHYSENTIPSQINYGCSQLIEEARKMEAERASGLGQGKG